MNKKDIQNSSPNLFQKFLYSLGAFIGFPFLITLSVLAFVDVNKYNNATEIQFITNCYAICYTLFPILIIVSTIVWHYIDVKRRKSNNPLSNQQLVYYCLVSCRYLLAAIIIFYGLDKLMVNQLNMSYYWYGDELGKLSGFQLTWSFFGYSKFYNSTIALAQVFGGLLLIFRRTTFFGALFLLPILINITLIDYNYDIPAKDIITVLLFMDIFLVCISAKSLITFFIYQQPIDPKQLVDNYGLNKNPNKLPKIVAVLGILLFAFFTNLKQMKAEVPSPFEGAWEDISVKNYNDSIPEKNTKLILRLFVEGNTATIKKTYQYEDFKLSYNHKNNNWISLTSLKDSTHTTSVIGHYKIINKDTLIFDGKDGKDKVQWILKRTSKGN